MTHYYRIGELGKPWGQPERDAWRAANSQVKRTYQKDVLDVIPTIVQQGHVEAVQYGALSYDKERFPLYALRPKEFAPNKPFVLVTGGVHGYETSGVKGALLFARTALPRFLEHFNIVICPCVSPWGYETINRWNPLALDPNRNFIVGNDRGASSPAEECRNLMQYVLGLNCTFLAHFDLHETTNSDEDEFMPATSARDGKPTHTRDVVPDGFYLVADSANADVDRKLQAAMLAAVSKVTHLAPDDGNGCIIGVPVVDGIPSLIELPCKDLHLCAGITGARYTTTTEVYPDSPKVNDEECNAAQSACVVGGLEWLLANVVNK